MPVWLVRPQGLKFADRSIRCGIATTCRARLDLLWSGQSENGVRLYLASDYRIAFIVILLSCILGVVTALTLKE